MSALEVELAARHHGHLVVRHHDHQLRHLVGGEDDPQARAQVVDVHAPFRCPHECRHHLAAGLVVHADDVGGQPADLEDRPLDFAWRDVRTGRLDHVAVAAVEVEEPVLVQRDQVTGVEPVVGVEGLVAFPPHVALHEEGAPEVQFAHLSRLALGPVVETDDAGVEPGHGAAERAPPRLGLLGLVVTGQAYAPRLGHAEHGVAQLGVGRPDRRRHDRVEVAPAYGRQVSRGERRVLGHVGHGSGEPVDHGGALAFEDVEDARRRRGVRAD